MALTTAQIQAAYVTFFNRPADVAGLNYWSTYKGSDVDLYNTFAQSAEYTSLFAGQNNTATVNTIYMNLLGRSPDVAGLNYWVGQLDTGKLTIGTIANAIKTGAQGTDATTVANKTTAATTFTTALDTTTEITGYASPSASSLAAVKTWLAAVTTDATLATQIAPAALTAITTTAATGGAATGTTFTLTKSVQALAGTEGNDTFIAGDEGGSATLNAGDTLTGASGTDTLKLFNTAAVLNTASFGSAIITGIENVEATLGASAQTLDVSANADVKMATLVNGFNGVVTLKAAQTAGLSGGIQTTAAATFAFSDVTGGADTANLVLNAADLTTTGGASGLTIAGVETLNVAATGANLLGTTTLAATTKIVITGAGSVSTTLASGLAKTIDGSAATGNLIIDNSAAAAAVQSIKTGTGNDTYTTKYADLTKDDAIDLGTGTDSLRFVDSATFNDAATKARLDKVVGVEQLGVNGTGITLTVDGDFVSQTSYYVAGTTGNAALSNIANNADITFGKTDIAANATGVNTIGMKLGANTLNVNLAGEKTGASVVGGVVATAGDGLAVTGSATINVKSTGTDGQPNNVLDLTAADNQSVVITGSQNLTLTAKAASAVTGFSIDGSAFTGKLTVTGTAASDIVKGGTGADIISGGAGAVADTLTGNAGNDKFIIVAGVTAATADVITDFVTKADSISFGVALAAAGDYTEATAAVADFAAALAAANLVLTNGAGVKQVNVQQVGSDSWAFFNDGAATGADQVVKLTGVALTGIEYADIVA